MAENDMFRGYYEPIPQAKDAESFGTFDPGDGRQLKVISESKGKDAPSGYAYMFLFPEQEQQRQDFLDVAQHIHDDHRLPGDKLNAKIDLFSRDMDIAASIHATFLYAKEEMVPPYALTFNLPDVDTDMNLQELSVWADKNFTNNAENYPALERLAFKGQSSAVHLILEQDIAAIYPDMAPAPKPL